MCKENSFFADVRDETRWPPSASLETFDFKRPLGMTRDLFIFLLDVFGFKVKWNGWANIVRFFYCCVESYKVGPNCGVMDNGHCVLGLRLSLLSYFLIDLQLDDDEFGCVTVGGAHAIHLYTDIITKHMVFFLSLSSYLKQHPPTFFLRIFSCYCVQWEKKKKRRRIEKTWWTRLLTLWSARLASMKRRKPTTTLWIYADDQIVVWMSFSIVLPLVSASKFFQKKKKSGIEEKRKWRKCFIILQICRHVRTCRVWGGGTLYNICQDCSLPLLRNRDTFGRVIQPVFLFSIHFLFLF